MWRRIEYNLSKLQLNDWVLGPSCRLFIAWLFVFLHFLSLLLVLSHLRRVFLVFGSTAQCLFRDLVFLSFLLLLVLSKHFVNFAFKMYSITKVLLLFHCPLSTFGNIPRKAANLHIWDAATSELHKTMMACQNSWRHICGQATIKCCTYCFSAAWHLASGHCYIVPCHVAKLDFSVVLLLLIRAGRWAQLSGKSSRHLSKERIFNERDKKSFNHAKHLLSGGKLLRPHSEINWFMEQQPSLHSPPAFFSLLPVLLVTVQMGHASQREVVKEKPKKKKKRG